MAIQPTDREMRHERNRQRAERRNTKRQEAWNKEHKLPGTHKQRHHARCILHSEQLGESTWRVWGGQAEHIITQAADKFTCDCYCNVTLGRLCTHIIKIQYADRL